MSLELCTKSVSSHQSYLLHLITQIQKYDTKIWIRKKTAENLKHRFNDFNVLRLFIYYYLTIQSDGTLSLAQRVLADATIVAEVTILQISYGQPHVRPITVLHDAGGILLVG